MATPDPDPSLDRAQRSVSALDVGASGVVLGAPGSGKTAALIARVRHLVHACGIDPGEIAVLTPTRHTATALRDRLALAVGVATPGPLARSVASFAFNLIRAAAVHDGAPAPRLLTAGDQDGIIADLLAGDEEDAFGAPDRWPVSLPPKARRTRQFRAELRAFAAECADQRLTPADVARLAADNSHPAWAASASFLREYRYVLGRMRPAHRDPAQLLHEAAELLADAPAQRLGATGNLRVLLVDDAQELTRGGIALVGAARARGVSVLAFGDPDIGSGAFRGAGPELFERLVSELNGVVHVLGENHRAAPALVRLTRRTTESIGATGRVDHRRPPGDEVPPGDAIRTLLAASPYEHTDLIARTLREWHLLGGIAWDRMAVIAHDTRQIVQLETDLSAAQVPVRTASVPRPLGGERAVRDMAALVRLGLTDPDRRSGGLIAEALLTPFGGLDAVGLRRLRARLRILELAEGGSRTADELLVEAMAEPAVLGMIDTEDSRRAQWTAQTLARVGASRAEGATIHELLWIVWDGSPPSRQWPRAAVDIGGDDAARALDSLVALFGVAKRTVERGGGQTPEGFVREILDGEVPEDVLTTPDPGARVALLTPAAALGTEFDAVVIAGVQDGVWPNTRLRGGMLDTWNLAEALAGRGKEHASAGVLDRRRSVLHEELRLFVRAVSRARSHLVVTAVDDDDQGPSPLLSFLPDPVQTVTDAGHPLTLRGVVAAHRRALTASTDSTVRAVAAGQLALLADAGVPGADPDQWYGGVGPSTDAPMIDPQRGAVAVSPSRLEGFETCGLDWAVRTLGGESRSFSAGLGTLLHAAMEQVPDGDPIALSEALESRWGELQFEADWLERQEHAWAGVLLGRLRSYLQRVNAERGEVVGTEVRFRLAVELAEHEQQPRVWVAGEGDVPKVAHAVLSGSIDRVELYPADTGEGLAEGTEPRVVVLDLKTGRSEARVSDSKVADDAQLAAYQLAVLHAGIGGAANAGARLLVLSKTLKDSDYRIAHQPALSAEQHAQFLRRVATDARAMTQRTFLARVDAHCTHDRFAVCRLHTVRAVSAG